MKKKGISLIILVITIVVIIILATAVIVTLNTNNPIAKAREAVFKGDLKTFEYELSIYKLNELSQDTLFNGDSLNANNDSASANIDIKETKMDEIIKGIKGTKYIDIIEIRNGKLGLKENVNEKEALWASQVVNLDPLIYENVSIKQFDNPSNYIKAFEVTADKDTTITRCGRNLLRPYQYKYSASDAEAYHITSDTNKASISCIAPNNATSQWCFGILADANILKSTFLSDTTYTANFEKIQSQTFLAIVNKNALEPISTSGWFGGKSYTTITTDKNFNVKNQVLYLWSINPYNGLDYKIPGWKAEVENAMLTLGSTPYSYEPYNGNDYIAKAGEKILVPALPGFNSIFSTTSNFKIVEVYK